MPYVSLRQAAWAHTPAGTQALGGPAKVAEWDAASKGMNLPDHVKRKKLAEALMAHKGKSTPSQQGG